MVLADYATKTTSMLTNLLLHITDTKHTALMILLSSHTHAAVRSALLERWQSSQGDISISPGGQQRTELPVRHNGSHPCTECTVDNNDCTGNGHKHGQIRRYEQVISEYECSETEQQGNGVENLA